MKGGGQAGSACPEFQTDRLARFNMDVILADSDQMYTAALADRLQSWEQADCIEQCQSPEDLHRLIARRKGAKRPTCFLYNATEFNALVHLPASPVWPPAWQAIPILPGQSDSQNCDRAVTDTCTLRENDPAQPKSDIQPVSPVCYHRFDPVSSLLAQLAAACGGEAETATVSEEEANEAATTCSVCSDSTDQALTTEARLWLSLTLTGQNAVASGRRRLLSLIGQGRQVIYLPLMPTYLMSAIEHRTQGPNLSDLLLNMLGDAVSPEDLGCYLQTSPEGFLCFRPPERADDLVTCDPDILRRLVVLLKQKANQDPTGQMLVFIHCAGLPLTSVAVVGVLCDICELELPQGQAFPAKSALAEAGRLLALLPASCRVIRHSPAEPLRQRLPQKGGRRDLALSS